MVLKLNLIVAGCKGGGIGNKGTLPWKLRNEMGYFTKMTSTVESEGKTNAVIMGRKTWDSIPLKFRPLSNRFNIVLSKTISKAEVNDNVAVCDSLDNAVKLLEQPQYRDTIESVWIIGGSAVYQAGLESPLCHRVYYTDIKAEFECDTFFPPIPKDFVLVTDHRVPEEIQQENGLQYQYQVFEKTSQ